MVVFASYPDDGGADDGYGDGDGDGGDVILLMLTISRN
jgi:hypothetical protein